MVLCGANAYEQKYYLNPEFTELPTQIKEELQIMCVLYTEEAGGVITLEFDDCGTLLVNTASNENDFSYDEIDADLKLRQILRSKQELFAQLELYYRIFIEGNLPEDALKESGNA